MGSVYSAVAGDMDVCPCDTFGSLRIGNCLGLFLPDLGSAVLFCLGFTYLEFIDRTAYLNHYYLAGLIAGLLMFMPAQRQWSVDAWRRPERFLPTVPQWTIWLLRFQLVVVYVFAGLARK